MTLGQLIDSFDVLPLVVIILFALCFSSYVKIATVFSIVRAGFGLNGLPSAFVTGSLAMVLSFFVMFPTLSASMQAMESNPATRIDSGLNAWKPFLKLNSDEAVVEKFLEVAKKDNIDTDSSSWRILAPSFLISELRDAFRTGLNLLLPFVLIDLLVAQILAVMGVARLEPLIISLPLKVALFVWLDAWSMISVNLVNTY